MAARACRATETISSASTGTPDSLLTSIDTLPRIEKARWAARSAGHNAAVLRNWAGNVTFAASRFHEPTSVEQVQELMAGAERVRVLGSGHSFSPVADTTGDLLRLGGLAPELTIADDTVTISAGMGGAAARGRVRAAQHRLAAPHHGRRGVRDRHPRLGRGQPSPRGVGVGGRAGRPGRVDLIPTSDVWQTVVEGLRSFDPGAKFRNAFLNDLVRFSGP